MAEAQPASVNPIVRFSTSAGEFSAEIFADKAPISADNFLSYVKEGFFDGLIFHRVIPRFMLQGGGFDSATSQFFINVTDNDLLDHKNTSPDGYGYAVFGQVTEGMDVVHKIEKTRTGNRGLHQDVPVEPVVIHSVKAV